jgi:hypothetical protein
LTGAAPITVLLLLALAGGFLFGYFCEYTRYPSLRGEGQQLYFFAAVFAVVLLLLSRVLLLFGNLLLLLVEWLFTCPCGEWVEAAWKYFAGPLYTEALPTFFLAFVLGPIAAWLANRWSDRDKISDGVIDDYGQELEKFLYASTQQRRLVYVGLDNRRVYVGWATKMPLPKPRRDAPKEHFTLLLAKSGYLTEDTLETRFTTYYGPVHNQIADGTITDLRSDDFQIVIPLDRMVVARPYSLDVDPSLFELSSEADAQGDTDERRA